MYSRDSRGARWIAAGYAKVQEHKDTQTTEEAHMHRTEREDIRRAKKDRAYVVTNYDGKKQTTNRAHLWDLVEQMATHSKQTRALYTYIQLAICTYRESEGATDDNGRHADGNPNVVLSNTHEHTNNKPEYKADEWCGDIVRKTRIEHGSLMVNTPLRFKELLPKQTCMFAGHTHKLPKKIAPTVTFKLPIVNKAENEMFTWQFCTRNDMSICDREQAREGDVHLAIAVENRRTHVGDSRTARKRTMSFSWPLTDCRSVSSALPPVTVKPV